MVRRAFELDPDNHDIQFGIGIYNYYAAIVPDLYPWVKPLMLFIPKGDRVKGLSQLKAASEKAHYANIEATYFLLQVYYNFEKVYPEALQIATDLHKMFPNNVLFHKYVGRCNSALGEWKELNRVFHEILDCVNSKCIGYDAAAEREANYYLGLSEMNFGKYDEALQYFYRADELSRILDVKEISGFMVMTNLKIGIIYDQQGKRDLAIVQYKKVLNMKDYQDAHQQAGQYLKIPYGKS